MSTRVTHHETNGKHSSYEQETKQINELSDSTLMEIDEFNNEHVLRLAKSAMIAGGIPDNDSIVTLIGEGFESDNCKAIENWIRSHIDMLVEIAPQNQIEKIIEEIDNRLEEVKTGYISCK